MPLTKEEYEKKTVTELKGMLTQKYPSSMGYNIGYSGWKKAELIEVLMGKREAPKNKTLKGKSQGASPYDKKTVTELKYLLTQKYPAAKGYNIGYSGWKKAELIEVLEGKRAAPKNKTLKRKGGNVPKHSKPQDIPKQEKKKEKEKVPEFTERKRQPYGFRAPSPPKGKTKPKGKEKKEKEKVPEFTERKRQPYGFRAPSPPKGKTKPKGKEKKSKSPPKRKEKTEIQKLKEKIEFLHGGILRDLMLSPLPVIIFFFTSEPHPNPQYRSMGTYTYDEGFGQYNFTGVRGKQRFNYVIPSDQLLNGTHKLLGKAENYIFIGIQGLPFTSYEFKVGQKQRKSPPKTKPTFTPFNRPIKPTDGPLFLAKHGIHTRKDYLKFMKANHSDAKPNQTKTEQDLFGDITQAYSNSTWNPDRNEFRKSPPRRKQYSKTPPRKY